MAQILFDVSDDLARKIRGLVESGRPAEITFRLRARRVVTVLALDEWTNDTPRTFAPHEHLDTRGNISVV